MKQAAAGDPQAFGRLVQAHQARMVRFATRLLGDRDAAEDAAQEAFLRLWRARECYEAQGAFDSFMPRILRNVCLDHLRRPKPPVSVGETPAEASPTQQPAGGQPEACLEAAALGEAVRGAVQALPPPQREVFILATTRASPTRRSPTCLAARSGRWHLGSTWRSRRCGAGGPLDSKARDDELRTRPSAARRRWSTANSPNARRERSAPTRRDVSFAARRSASALPSESGKGLASRSRRRLGRGRPAAGDRLAARLAAAVGCLVGHARLSGASRGGACRRCRRRVPPPRSRGGDGGGGTGAAGRRDPGGGSPGAGRHAGLPVHRAARFRWY